LSPPDSSGKLEVTLPPAIQELVTPNTYFLINKLDLVPTLSAKILIQIRLGEDDVISSESGRVWTTSLVTGQGTHTFVERFAGALKEQYVLFLTS
jgi:tRNA modification GTPase